MFIDIKIWIFLSQKNNTGVTSWTQFDSQHHSLSTKLQVISEHYWKQLTTPLHSPKARKILLMFWISAILPWLGVYKLVSFYNPYLKFSNFLDIKLHNFWHCLFDHCFCPFYLQYNKTISYPFCSTLFSGLGSHEVCQVHLAQMNSGQLYAK